ncbi:MAG: hypothetical protein QM765_00235 [Myxococcales bacterium]
MKPRRWNSDRARDTVSREVPIIEAISCCVGRARMTTSPWLASPSALASSRR